MAGLIMGLVTLLATAAVCEPPVNGVSSSGGYHYSAPNQNYGPPDHSYISPSQEYGSPDHYVAPSAGNFGNYAHNPPSSSYGSPPDGTSYDYQGQADHHHHEGHNHDHSEPKSYEFGYAVKDAHSGNDYNRKEVSDGNTVRGEYRVQLPDGRTQIVTYHADWQTGFHADVRYEGEAHYPETYNHHQAPNQGYNYQNPSQGYGAPHQHDSYLPPTAGNVYSPPEFSGSLTGFHGNQGHHY